MVSNHDGVEWAPALVSEVWIQILALVLGSLVTWDKWLTSSPGMLHLS